MKAKAAKDCMPKFVIKANVKLTDIAFKILLFLKAYINNIIIIPSEEQSHFIKSARSEATITTNAINVASNTLLSLKRVLIYSRTHIIRTPIKSVKNTF